MNRFLCGITLPVLTIVAAESVQAQTSGASAQDAQMKSLFVVDEKDRRAPVDYGLGPGVKPGVSTRAAIMMAAPLAVPAAVPTGGPTAQTKGLFGASAAWPLIPLHAILLPDGRVMTYGTNEKGQQGGQFIYDVWDPTKGTDASSHLTLPNTTGTDIFCSAQSVLSSTGKVLITGGDVTKNGVRNYSTAQTEIFDAQLNDIKPNSAMTYQRWYPTAIGLPNGEVAVLGGRQAPETDAVITPEVFNTTTGWRTLPGAASNPAFGAVAYNWYYPRAFVTPFGTTLVLGHDGSTWSMSTAGAGSITRLAPQGLPGDAAFPAVYYAPGRVLSLRGNKKVNLVNLTTSTPSITTTADIDQVRYWGNATVLPDGNVLVTGGSSGFNVLTGVAYNSMIWNPATGAWTVGAAAAKPRLYHSISLLLPDATVLTGGGGAPGPVNNLNAEIYYPPYLFNATGGPAPRPTIVSAPAVARVGQQFTVTVGSGQKITRVAMMKTGSVTHSFDPDQRVPPVSFTQSGNNVTIAVWTNVNTALPGYYMVFVFQNNVPSIAKIVRVTT